MLLSQKIEELLLQVQDARHTVGEFVLEKGADLQNLTITDVADLTYTSKATVVRFAKKLGFSGWREFVQEWMSEIRYLDAHKGDVDANYPFKKDDSIFMIMENMKLLMVESILDTIEINHEATIHKAAVRLAKANHIVIFTRSPNLYVAELFKRKMLSIGRFCSVAAAGEMGLHARALTPDDCALLISYSGHPGEVEPMKHLPALLEGHVPVVAITSDGDNYLHRMLDCVLRMSTKERLYTKISNFATEESLQYLLNVLFSLIFARDYDANIEWKISQASLLEKDRKEQSAGILEP